MFYRHLYIKQSFVYKICRHSKPLILELKPACYLLVQLPIWKGIINVLISRQCGSFDKNTPHLQRKGYKITHFFSSLFFKQEKGYIDVMRLFSNLQQLQMIHSALPEVFLIKFIKQKSYLGSCALAVITQFLLMLK